MFKFGIKVMIGENWSAGKWLLLVEFQSIM